MLSLLVLDAQPYRASCWSPSKELIGVISQVQGTVAFAIDSLSDKISLKTITINENPMTTSKVTYQGDLRTTAIHLQSINEIITDAPTDNQGKGEAFSPTDLLATSLASCMLTIIGIKARDMDIDIAGTTAEVTKVMAADPRRVSEVHVAITFNQNLDNKTQKIFYNTALTCPVAKSIHPDIIQKVTINSKSY